MIKKFFGIIVLAILFMKCGNDGSSGSHGTEVIDIPINEDGEINEDEIAKITFEETVLELGKISQGEVISHEFEFSNTGNAPLLIATVDGSCGCTIPRNWPTDLILPGEGGVIEVEFDSDGLTGKQVVSVIISANTFPAATQLVLNTEIVVPDNMK
ncbi:MAG: DUF1573 domain-containing protein [Bacteroidota bacterium]